MKLLVADQDRHMVAMIASWLKVLGNEVYCASSREQVKINWIENHPDLVILDNTLEDKDALAMCCELQREHDALILVITEGKYVRDEVYCLESGADDYLRKPFFPAQFLARINALKRRMSTTILIDGKDPLLPLARERKGKAPRREVSKRTAKLPHRSPE